MAVAQRCFLSDSRFSLPPHTLVRQVTCQRRARRAAGPRSASTTPSTAATTPMTRWLMTTRPVWMKKRRPLPGLCFPSNPSAFCAGGLLPCHQSGLHRGPQPVAPFPDGRHHHSVSLPVSRACKMFSQRLFPSLRAITKRSSNTCCILWGRYSVFHRRGPILWGWIFRFDLPLCAPRFTMLNLQRQSDRLGVFASRWLNNKSGVYSLGLWNASDSRAGTQEVRNIRCLCSFRSCWTRRVAEQSTRLRPTASAPGTHLFENSQEGGFT